MLCKSYDLMDSVYILRRELNLHPHSASIGNCKPKGTIINSTNVIAGIDCPNIHPEWAVKILVSKDNKAVKVTFRYTKSAPTSPKTSHVINSMISKNPYLTTNGWKNVYKNSNYLEKRVGTSPADIAAIVAEVIYIITHIL